MHQDEASIIQDILENKPIDIQAFYARISTYDQAEPEKSIQGRIDAVQHMMEIKVISYLEAEAEIYEIYHPISRAEAMQKQKIRDPSRVFAGLNYYDSDNGRCFITTSLLGEGVNCIGETGFEIMLGLWLGEISPIISKGFHVHVDYPNAGRDCFSPGMEYSAKLPMPQAVNQEYRRFFAHVFSNRGKDQLRNGNPDYALNDFEMACALSPDYTVSRLYTGISKLHLGNSKIAAEDVINAYSMNREIVDWLVSRPTFTKSEESFICSIIG